MSTVISRAPVRGFSRRSPARGAQPEGSHSGRAWLQYGLAVAVFGILFSFWQVEPVPDDVHLAAILVWAVCLFPISHWRASGGRGVPMFELICLAYGSQYSLPVYLDPNAVSTWIGIVPVRWDDTLQALLLTALGIGAMILAFYGGRRLLAGRLPRVDLPLDRQHRLAYVVAGLVLGLAFQAIQNGGLGVANSSGSAAILRVLASQSYVALILLAEALYSRQLTGVIWRLLLYGSVAVLVVLGMSTGTLESALVPVALLVIVYWYARRRFPLRWVMLGLVLFLILNSVKNDYRLAVQQGTVGSGVASRSLAWADLAVKRLELAAQGGLTAGSQGLVRDSAGRLDLVHIFAHVHGLTPSAIPYYSGQTYSYLASAWIPRFLWTDKPQAQSASGGTDVTYGLAYANDVSTSIGLGQPAEAYANFGPLGVLLILALQGLFFALMDAVFNGPGSDGGRAVYLSVMVFFLNGIGTGTAILFGAVIQNCLASALVLKAFSRWAPVEAVLELARQRPGAVRRSRPRPGSRTLGVQIASRLRPQPEPGMGVKPSRRNPAATTRPRRGETAARGEAGRLPAAWRAAPALPGGRGALMAGGVVPVWAAPAGDVVSGRAAEAQLVDLEPLTAGGGRNGGMILETASFDPAPRESPTVVDAELLPPEGGPNRP
ncbi:MAG: hypothetical protein JOZ41_04250 [Chloroflexi bacterium]|nr:hypothetical protein [Chloroflexota bacterium]